MSGGLKIGFYTTGQAFDGGTLEHRPLGGSETAFIQISRALARLGHTVIAFNNCENTGTYDGVSYHHFKNSLQLLATEEFDVFIVSRYCAFFNLPFKSELKILWNHDTLDNPKELRTVHDEIDLLFVLSKFHKNNFLTRLPALDDRLIVTRNGLDFDLLDSSASDNGTDPNKFIYASRPERGLKILLENIWPRIHRYNPDFKLYICGYNPKLEGLPQDLASLYEYLVMLMDKTPGVVSLGSLDKKSYYRHLSESRMMLYPCIFPEVSCIAVLEAQALGVPVLCSDSFALSESVVTAMTKIGGRPGSNEYIDNYVERAIKFFKNPQLLKEVAEEGRTKIRSRYCWNLIASEWERIFKLGLRAKQQPELFTEMKPEKNEVCH